MTAEELISKLNHKSLTVREILGDNILFNIDGKLAFAIRLSDSSLQVYTMDMALRVFVSVNLHKLFIEDDVLFLDENKESYILL